MSWYSWYVIFVYVVVMIKHFENIHYYIRNLNFKSTFIEFNTFQKHLADSKLSTNTYLMSVAAIFQKL